MKRTREWLIGFLVIALIAGMLPACGIGKPTLKIYTSFPMRGITAGVSIVNAIELKLADAKWQVDGYPIELVKLDGGNEKGQWDPAIEEANVKQAVDDKSAIAYIGPFYSGAAEESIPIASQAGLLQISPTAAWPGLTKVGFEPGQPARFYRTGQRTFYRVCPTDDVQALVAVRWARSLGFRRIYILDDGEAYGKGMADLFELQAKIAGLTIRGHDTIDTKATDFMGVMSRLWLTPPPDMVFLSGYTPNGIVPLLRQMRTVKPAITSTLMAANTIVDTAFVQGVGAYAEGAYVTLGGISSSQLITGTGKIFLQAYQAKYNQLPDPPAIYGYDAAFAVLQALGAAQTKDRAGVLKAMAEPQKFKGASGEFSFDENGDTTLVVASGLEIKSGQFQFVQLLDVTQ